MKRILVFLSVWVLLGLAPALTAYAQSQRFFSVISDVPLMPGLAELADQAVVFDKPGGRFAESLADLGEISAASVAAYYMSVLPQFGWAPEGENRYQREGEILVFAFEQSQGRPVVRVSLEPQVR